MPNEDVRRSVISANLMIQLAVSRGMEQDRCLRDSGIDPATLADPKGVFVLREEPQSVARAVLGRNDIYGDQRVAYVLDLTRPDGMFLARDFVIRDGDTVYVTEAPFVQWQKTLSAILTPASQIGSTSRSFE